MSEILIPVAAGELFDKITILQIKAERVVDEAKLSNIRCELNMLNDVASRLVFSDPQMIVALQERLKSVNEEIWDAENVVRDHDRRESFGEDFTLVARSTYRNNDRRAALKRQISVLAGSAILEEKSHSS